MKYHTNILVPAVTKWKDGQRVEISPATTVKVFVEIDEAAVARTLGMKAWKNKSKKAHEMGGLVRVIECRSL